MNKPTRRQHFLPRFYLRNFAVPVFSENLRVFDLRSKEWLERTPQGVGWFPHLLSQLTDDGKQSDDFDKFIEENVERLAVPIFKRIGEGHVPTEQDRPCLALFIAITAARSPWLLRNVLSEYLAKLPAQELKALEDRREEWYSQPSLLRRKTQSTEEYLKPSGLAAIWSWSLSIQKRLASWNWFFRRFSGDCSVITSERPVFMEHENGIYLVTFPLSCQMAVIISNAPNIRTDGKDLDDARAINVGIAHYASEYLVASSYKFPGSQLIINA